MPKFASVTQEYVSPNGNFGLPDALRLYFCSTSYRECVSTKEPIISSVKRCPSLRQTLNSICIRNIPWMHSKCLGCAHCLTELTCFQSFTVSLLLLDAPCLRTAQIDMPSVPALIKAMILRWLKPSDWWDWLSHLPCHSSWPDFSLFHQFTLVTPRKAWSTQNLQRESQN